MALRLTQEQTQHEHERQGYRGDDHGDDRHELIRHRQLVSQLVEIGREDEQPLRIAEHERQAEQLETEEEN